MEMLDNLDKNPATGMGKKVSTIHTLHISFEYSPLIGVLGSIFYAGHIDPPICVAKHDPKM